MTTFSTLEETTSDCDSDEDTSDNFTTNPVQNPIRTPWPIQIAKEMVPAKKSAMIELLREYKDVFMWSYEDMEDLHPKFYQHGIRLSKDAMLIQQRRYQMNPNRAGMVIEEIDKLL